LRFAQHDHVNKNAPVLVEEEILGLQLLNGRIEGVIVEQNRSEHAALGFHVLRQRPLESSFAGHTYSLFIRHAILTCRRRDATLNI
jgi:hypothetical protein